MEAEEKKEEVVETIDWETRYKYLAAELDNTKKRFQKDMISYKRVLTQHILTSILPVYESIINAEKQTSIDLTSIKDQFINCLKNFQISKIEVKVGDKLTLKREINRYDDKAILILDSQERKLGYVPEKDNVVFSRLMDAGKLLIAKVNEVKDMEYFFKISISIYLVDY